MGTHKFLNYIKNLFIRKYGISTIYESCGKKLSKVTQRFDVTQIDKVRK